MDLVPHRAGMRQVRLGEKYFQAAVCACLSEIRGIHDAGARLSCPFYRHLLRQGRRGCEANHVVPMKLSGAGFCSAMSRFPFVCWRSSNRQIREEMKDESEWPGATAKF